MPEMLLNSRTFDPALESRLGIGHHRGMNVVALVGRTADKPFNPGGDRVVVKLDVPSDRRPDVFDRIEVHCFGAVGELALAKVKPGDVLSVRGRLEIRTGRDGDNSFQELRVVGHHIARVS